MKAGAFARRSKMNTAAAPVVQEPVVPVMGPEWSIAPEAPAPVSFAGKDMNRRPGLFGRMGNALSRVDWERVFAAMRTDPSHMQSLLETRENAAERMRAEAEAELERRGMKQENAERQTALQALPEHLRPVAPLLTNEGISRVMAPSPPSWQIDERTGRPYVIQGGAIRYGQGNITPQPAGGGGATWGPLSPETAAQYQGLNPRDYQQSSSGEIRQIPGAAGRLRFDQQQRAAVNSAVTSLESVANVNESIESARRLASDLSTGTFGGLTRNIPGSPAYDLDRAVDTIKANIGFEALQTMRDNSPTGGALGQIAVQELQMLQSVVDSLDTARSPREFARALDRVEAYMARREARNRQIIDAYNADIQAAGGDAAPAGGGDAPIRWGRDANGNPIRLGQ